MARVAIPITVIDGAGNAKQGASVTVRKRSDSTLATLYAGETGGTTVANPLSTDVNGRVSGWIDRGAYKCTVAGSGITTYDEMLDAAPAADGSADSSWVQALAATDFGTAENGLAYAAFSARMNANNSLPNNNPGTLVFQTEDYDYGNFYDPATGVFTAPVAGLYEFGVFLNCLAMTTAGAALWALLETTAAIPVKLRQFDQRFCTGNGAQDVQLAAQVVVPLAATTGVRVRASQNDGVARNLSGNTTNTELACRFNGKLIGLI